REEVDELCERLIGYFDHGEPLSADVVRNATFTTRKGAAGYDEGSVDAFLSRAVSVILAVGWCITGFSKRRQNSAKFRSVFVANEHHFGRYSGFYRLHWNPGNGCYLSTP